VKLESRCAVDAQFLVQVQDGPLGDGLIGKALASEVRITGSKPAPPLFGRVAQVVSALLLKSSNHMVYRFDSCPFRLWGASLAVKHAIVARARPVRVWCLPPRGGCSAIGSVLECESRGYGFESRQSPLAGL
jgi:hypothetical protein